MYTLRKRFTFEAAHMLPHHDGKCARLHGHSWVLMVEVQSQTLHQSGPKQGMVMDYYDIGQAVRPLLEGQLDHFYLNESLGLESPTSEAIANWVYHQLKPRINGLTAVTVEETCTAACEYRGVIP